MTIKGANLSEKKSRPFKMLGLINQLWINPDLQIEGETQNSDQATHIKVQTLKILKN